MAVIKASEFKATCLALLDHVAAGGDEIVITKRGTPVARLVGIESTASLEGSVRIVDDDLLSTGEPWHADA